MSEAFDLKAFQRFTNNLRIDTKERGELILGKSLLGPQRYVIDEIAKGMQDGIRDFVTLKAARSESRTSQSGF